MMFCSDELAAGKEEPASGVPLVGGSRIREGRGKMGVAWGGGFENAGQDIVEIPDGVELIEVVFSQADAFEVLDENLVCDVVVGHGHGQSATATLEGGVGEG